MPAEYSSDQFMWFVDRQQADKLPKGESADWFFGPKKAFEVLSVEFGLSGEGKDMVETGSSDISKATAGKSQFNEMAVKKYVDKSSVKLYQSCSEGTEFDTAYVAIRKASGAGYLLFMQYILRMVRVVGVTWAVSANERPQETVRLNFKAMGFRYVPQDVTGDIKRSRKDDSGSKGLEWLWSTVSQRPNLYVEDGKESIMPFENDIVVPPNRPSE